MQSTYINNDKGVCVQENTDSFLSIDVIWNIIYTYRKAEKVLYEIDKIWQYKSCNLIDNNQVSG